MAFEVEKKFVIHGNSESKLIKNGGIIKREISFSDAYFDTKHYDLSLADTWLRKREGKWELKYPPQERYNSSICQYIELDSDEEIASFLIHKFPSLFKAFNATMADISQSLFEFAKFSTNRKTYAIHDFHVDFDRTDFGFEVGEIELMNYDKNNTSLNSMVDKVEIFAASIDFSTSKERVKGKVEEFLQRFRPDHYHTLVAANIFPAKV